MYRSWLLGLAVLLASTACLSEDPADGSLDNEQPYIVGGSPVVEGEYPAVVGLYDGTHLCTGTLVHAEWVITAAHCVTPSLTGYATLGEVVSAFYILLDDIDLTDQNVTSTRVNLQEVFIHPGWDPKDLGDNDVAVLHLAQPVTDRKPIPIFRTPVPTATPVTQVGYGVSDPDTKSGAGVLRTLNTVTMDCGSSYSDINLLCFDANDGNGTCFGDSGGPTFVTVGGAPEIAGVTSFGTSELCIGMDASTHLASELDFIDAHVPKTAGSTPQVGDPQAQPEIGDAPTILGGCSVLGRAAAKSDESSALAAFLLLSLVLLILRLRNRSKRS
jgi:secreted trypsin-like serine protease